MRRQEEGDGFALTPRAWVTVGAAVLGLVFIAENTARTQIRFIVPRVESPLWVALLVTFGCGVVAGWFAARSRRD